MNRTDLERKLQSAYASLSAPDVLDSVLSDCPSQKGAIIMMHDRKKSFATRWAGIAAAFILFAGSAVGLGGYQLNHRPDATVSLDVNPSVELTTNRNDRVLQVTANNDDGAAILGSMDLTGSNLDVAVNALIGSMVRNGYINDLSNSILLSVNAKDPARGAALQERLTEEIDQLLHTESFSGSVLSQTLSDSEDLRSMAEQHSITPGKARLIQEVVAADPHYSFETLSALSINELNLIHQNLPAETSQIATTGAASDKAYIGSDAAESAALTHAGLTDSEVLYLHTEYDYENGHMVYEVEFSSGGLEYDYTIDAETGAILEAETDIDNDRDEIRSSPAPAPAGDGAAAVSESSVPTRDESTDTARSEAADTALTDAGLTAPDAVNLRTETDTENGRPVHEVEFESGGLEYDYTIDAETGAILEAETDIDEPDDDLDDILEPDDDDDDWDDDLEDILDPDDDDDRDDALEDLFDPDEDDRDEIRSTPASVPAGDGAAAVSESSVPTRDESTDAARNEAADTALTDAGLTNSDTVNLRTETDVENGRPVHEVEFESGGREYDYTIDAATGAILEAETDIDEPDDDLDDILDLDDDDDDEDDRDDD